MASRNGHTVFEMLTSGWSRKVTDFNGSGSVGVSIPAEFADDHNIEIGDQVAVKRSDDDQPVLELHFENPPSDE